MQDKWKALVACFGIGSITAIEVVNLVTTGVDGTLATAICTTIGAIVTAVVVKKVGSKSEGST